MRRFKKKIDGTVVELFPNDGKPWAPEYKPTKAKKVPAPKKKRTPSPINKADADLWTVVSIYIRRRDADEFGMCKCITCGKRKHWKQMQAGHFIGRGMLITKFLEQNLHAQCVQCNYYKSGLQYQHGLAINKKYGEGTAEKIRIMSQTLVKWTVQDYLVLTHKFKGMIANLPSHE